MLPRRTFLKAGLLAAAPALAAPVAQAAAAAATGARHFVLVDEQLAASARFGQAFAAEARIARHALLTQWSQLQQVLGTQGSISGVTRRSDLPLVQQLVAAHGMRLVFEHAHDLRTPDAAAQAGWAQALVAQAAQQTCARAGSVPVACRSGVAPQVAAPQAGHLVGWTLVYGAA